MQRLLMSSGFIVPRQPRWINAHSRMYFPLERMNQTPSSSESTIMFDAFSRILDWRGRDGLWRNTMLPPIDVNGQGINTDGLAVAMDRWPGSQGIVTGVYLYAGSSRKDLCRRSNGEDLPSPGQDDAVIYLTDREVTPQVSPPPRLLERRVGRSTRDVTNSELIATYNLLATGLNVPRIPIAYEDTFAALGGLGLAPQVNN